MHSEELVKAKNALAVASDDAKEPAEKVLRECERRITKLNREKEERLAAERKRQQISQSIYALKVSNTHLKCPSRPSCLKP